MGYERVLMDAYLASVYAYICMYMYQCAYLTATLTEVSESPLADMMNDFYLSQSRKVWAIWLG